nr:MAG TPA: hypothetical protein [Caudoviricetes sp.]
MSLWGPNSNSVPMLPWPKVHPCKGHKTKCNKMEDDRKRV